MKFTRIKSSSIESFLYLPRLRTLLIRFPGDEGAYAYYEVAPVEASAFANAPSKGKFFNLRIKHGFDHAYLEGEALERAFLREQVREKRAVRGADQRSLALFYQAFRKDFPKLAESAW
jgi:hypothetical protein